MARTEPDPPPGKKELEKSFGNISDAHWSRARKGMNEEALEYYRQRSKAPGVEQGGAERNFYCMECDGVIPFDQGSGRCPHCDAELDQDVRRYFNWVEMDKAPRSDLRALLPVFGGVALAVAILVLLLILLLS